uniref:Uncharacterized protein n=1 Tax=Oryza meridionalis TaxID=40149 RepID=A0A0E0CIZ3_9ORYZ
MAALRRSLADGKTTGLENVNVGEIFSHYLFMSGTLISQVKLLKWLIHFVVAVVEDWKLSSSTE